MSENQVMPQELQNQMPLAVERRLRLSEVAAKCGGSSNFAAAAAATVDDYIKWANAELNKDDGNTSKVCLLPSCPITLSAEFSHHCCSKLTQVVVIKTADVAGLGNRLQAMTSAFLFAIVTKRVLLIDWAENSNAIVRSFLFVFVVVCDRWRFLFASLDFFVLRMNIFIFHPTMSHVASRFQSLPSSEQSSMPPLDALFLTPCVTPASIG